MWEKQDIETLVVATQDFSDSGHCHNKKYQHPCKRFAKFDYIIRITDKYRLNFKEWWKHSLSTPSTE